MVLIHGRGASATDILGLAAELDFPGLAYLAPEAAGNTWYPYSFLAPIEKNQPWLESALRLLGETVKRVVAAGIPRSNVGIVGFSQGACLATEFVARNAARYGGLIAFTGGLIGPPEPSSSILVSFPALPVSSAPVILIHTFLGKESRSRLLFCLRSALPLRCDAIRVCRIRLIKTKSSKPKTSCGNSLAKERAV